MRGERFQVAVVGAGAVGATSAYAMLVRGAARRVVLHDINMAARYCDEIIAMRDGCIVAHGAPAEIVDAGVLDRIYGIAMGTMTHPVTGVPVSYVL